MGVDVLPPSAIFEKEKMFEVIKQCFLVIVGPSGSGKTTLEKELNSMYPHIFRKVIQITTRKMREKEIQGDPYIFVEKEIFQIMKETLIGVVESESKFENGYGSIFFPITNKIQTIILSEEGLIDFKNKVSNTDYVVVGLDSDFTSRNERKNILGREINVLSMADRVFKVMKGDSPDEILWVHPLEIMLLLKDLKFIKEVSTDEC